MFTFSLAEAFITVFIGMGPVKVLLVYIASTKDLDKGTRRKMARRIVIVAGSVAVGLFVVGAFLQQILHFSIGALNIIGGLILLLLALKMVWAAERVRERCGQRRRSDGDGCFSACHPTDAQPRRHSLACSRLFPGDRHPQFDRGGRI